MRQENEKSRNIMAQPHKLDDLISYQEGSVVSRALIDKKTGTVTLFAFDKGQRLSEHKALFEALVYVLDGETEITISGEPFLLKKGDVVIMPANEPHAVRAVTPFKMALVMIKSA